MAAIAKLRLARNQLARDTDEATNTLEELQHDTRRILQNLRELSRGIHPLILTHRGLTDALDTQARHLPLQVRIDAAPDVRVTRYAEEVEATAYYVISEGLTNVLKHAGTNEATVRLHTSDGRLIAEVIDRGRGCDGAPRGSGLTGLRDRVESVGGSWTSAANPPRAPRCARCCPPELQRMSMPDRLRLVLAEDNYLVREGTHRLLEDTGAIEVVATAGDAPQLLRVVERHQPDVVVTDIRMPPATH